MLLEDFRKEISHPDLAIGLEGFLLCGGSYSVSFAGLFSQIGRNRLLPCLLSQVVDKVELQSCYAGSLLVMVCWCLLG